MVKLDIKIYEDNASRVSKQIFCASCEIDKDETIAGYGSTPYEALRDFVNELEYQHEYFRPD